jgi:hypothetical protein
MPCIRAWLQCLVIQSLFGRAECLFDQFTVSMQGSIIFPGDICQPENSSPQGLNMNNRRCNLRIKTKPSATRQG